MTSLKPYAKAIVAVVGAIVTGLTQVFPDSPDVSRWCAFVMSVLTVAAVYLVPNADPTGTHQDESVQPPTEAELPAGDYIPGTVDHLVNDALSQPYTGDSKTDATFYGGDTTTTDPAPKPPTGPQPGGYWGGI